MDPFLPKLEGPTYVDCSKSRSRRRFGVRKLSCQDLWRVRHDVLQLNDVCWKKMSKFSIKLMWNNSDITWKAHWQPTTKSASQRKTGCLFFNSSKDSKDWDDLTQVAWQEWEDGYVGVDTRLTFPHRLLCWCWCCPIIADAYIIILPRRNRNSKGCNVLKFISILIRKLLKPSWLDSCHSSTLRNGTFKDSSCFLKWWIHWVNFTTVWWLTRAPFEVGSAFLATAMAHPSDVQNEL